MRGADEVALYKKIVLLNSFLIKLSESALRVSTFGAGKKRVVRQPGTLVIKLLRFFYSRKHFERVFEAMHAEFWTEYVEDLSEGRKWRARWTMLRFYFAVVTSIGILRWLRIFAAWISSFVPSN